MSKVPVGAIPVDVGGLHTPMLGGQNVEKYLERAFWK